jgi:dipeptidyl aminopeptidase/acylaminoacyl peptidase
MEKIRKAISMKQHAILPSFLLVVFVSVSSASAQSGYLTLEDLQKQVDISSPALSPDGKTAVFITSRADFESNTYERQLLQIDLATKQTKLLSARKGISRPTWSPDGHYLGFLAPGRRVNRSTSYLSAAVKPFRSLPHQRESGASLGARMGSTLRTSPMRRSRKTRIGILTTNHSRSAAMVT